MPTLVDDLRFRGLIRQITDDELLAKLDRGGLTFYAGFDPSAASLHVGTLLLLCVMRRLQLAGHRPIAVAGGGTGLIGDPGGKDDERQLMGVGELESNLEGISAQLARFLGVSPLGRAAPALVLDNADWLRDLRAMDLLRDVGKHFTVNHMVAKESVRARLERPDQGISFTEFSYMLLQAYDFLVLHREHGCDLQLGGNDQWGNITAGVELVRRVCRAQVHGLTVPLVTRADGTKFGKTEQGTVWLSGAMTSPYRLYQFFVGTEDEMVGDYLRWFTFLTHQQITALDAETKEHPQRRSAARALALEVCELVHGTSEARRAEHASDALFGDGVRDLDETTLLEAFDDAPSSSVPRSSLTATEPLTLVDALVSSGLSSSKGAARRAISQGGVYVNNHREASEERQLRTEDLLHDRYVLLRRGRREYHLLKAE